MYQICHNQEFPEGARLRPPFPTHNNVVTLSDFCWPGNFQRACSTPDALSESNILFVISCDNIYTGESLPASSGKGMGKVFSWAHGSLPRSKQWHQKVFMFECRFTNTVLYPQISQDSQGAAPDKVHSLQLVVGLLGYSALSAISTLLQWDVEILCVQWDVETFYLRQHWTLCQLYFRRLWATAVGGYKSWCLCIVI